MFSVSSPDLFYNLAICSDVFNIPAQEVYQRVAFENAYYGGDKPKGTRIVFVNGKEFSNANFKKYRKLAFSLFQALGQWSGNDRKRGEGRGGGGGQEVGERGASEVWDRKDPAHRLIMA